MLNVNVVYPKDNWILQIIALELLKAKSPEVVFGGSQKLDSEADFNYWINWKWWKHLYPGLDKSKYDVIWFTHFDEEDSTEIIDRADLVVAKSLHGCKCLENKGISGSKIRILSAIGPIKGIKFRKVRLGISGRPYLKTKRKGEDLLIQLSEDLNSDVFEFVFSNKKWLDLNIKCRIVEGNKFYDEIDYWLSTSKAEGGPMDIINAIKCGIPIISTNIGFIYNLKTYEDFTYNNYEDLLDYLERIQDSKLDKLKISKQYTWDNFRKWHIGLFKELANENSSRYGSGGK